MQSSRESNAKARWRTYVFVGAGVAVVMLFVVLHLTGALGPGGH
jgi:hypothetical protein